MHIETGSNKLSRVDYDDDSENLERGNQFQVTVLVLVFKNRGTPLKTVALGENPHQCKQHLICQL
jgi:hypothetical protein